VALVRVHDRSGSPVMRAAVWSESGIASAHSPLGKVVLNNHKVSFVVSRQWNLQDIHCYHLPWAANWHTHKWCTLRHTKLRLLTNFTVSTMFLHILGHTNPIRFLPQSIQCPFYSLVTSCWGIVVTFHCILTKGS
jgi:hypothetical protein